MDRHDENEIVDHRSDVVTDDRTDVVTDDRIDIERSERVGGETVMNGRDVDVRRDPGVREARERFGGLDVPASLAGMLVAVALLVLLAGLASAAIGAIAFQTGASGNETQLSVGALITAGVVLLLSFLIGGWAAGRMARYSGALNGLMVAVWFVLLLAILAGLGALLGNTYNLFDNLRVAKANLPNWFSADTVTTGAIISSIAFAAIMILGAVGGGLWGQRLHRRADEVIVAAGRGDVVTERIREVDHR